jgi:hypothetical protein
MSVAIGIMAANGAAQTPEVRGVVFGDYLYVANHADTLVDGLSALSVRRVYFTADKKFNEKYFLRLRLEMSDALGEPMRYRVESGGVRTSERLEPFVKHLFLAIRNAIPHSQLLLGLAGTPYYDSEESVWGLRSIEKTALDLNGFVSTVDFGVGLEGAFRSGGRLRYHVMAGNGNNTRNESDNSKRVYGSLQYNGPFGLMITPYADYQFKDGEIEDGIRAKADSIASSTNELSTIAVFAGIKRPKVRLGASFIQQIKKLLLVDDDVTKSLSRSARGVSFFAIFQPKNSAGIFARFDTFDPNTDAPNDGYKLFIAGIDLAPFESVHFMPNLWLQDFQAANKASTTVLRLSFEFKY